MTERVSRVTLGGVGLALLIGVVGGSAACSSAPELSADLSRNAPNPDGKDEGATCASGDDCKSLTCNDGACTPVVVGGNPTDATRNGGETDIDCGGPSAPKCKDGKACLVATDCESAACTGGACKAPSPDDKLKNGDESDIDCGGAKAPKCALEKSCAKNEDCASDACSYEKKCIAFPTCTAHFGGDTCGSGETGEPGAKHENCCATVSSPSGFKYGKYAITAGRMRAFVDRHAGNLQKWAATKPKGWNQAWTAELPASMEEAAYLLGPDEKRGCNITPDGRGSRTYWQPPKGEEKNDFPQDVLDEKALNCVPWHMAQAVCVADGGRLPSNAEVKAMITNEGKSTWPWQPDDKTSYSESAQDDRVVHRYSYMTPNPPANMRTDGDDPLDRSFWIAPPGRRPGGANQLGVEDALGNVMSWVNDGPLKFAWSLSWEEHPRVEPAGTWPTAGGKGKNENNGYYAIGGRCVFDKP